MTTLTLDGVDVMGERLAEEVGLSYVLDLGLITFINFFLGVLSKNAYVFQVLELIKQKPHLRKISFVAHSVGGLVARYAIGKLYRPPENSGDDKSADAGKQESIGTIGNLLPLNFITVATPHLGSRGNKQVSQL